MKLQLKCHNGMSFVISECLTSLNSDELSINKPPEGMGGANKDDSVAMDTTTGQTSLTGETSLTGLENPSVQQLLLEAYGNIGEPDSLYGVCASKSASKETWMYLYEQEGDWEKSLSKEIEGGEGERRRGKQRWLRREREGGKERERGDGGGGKRERMEGEGEMGGRGRKGGSKRGKMSNVMCMYSGTSYLKQGHLRFWYHPCEIGTPRISMSKFLLYLNITSISRCL